MTGHENKQIKCFRCKQKGHFKNRCPVNLTEQHVNFMAQNESKLIKDAVIGNKIVKCFIDLGSQCSLINNAVIAELNLKVERLNQPLKLVTLSHHALNTGSYVT